MIQATSSVHQGALQRLRSIVDAAEIILKVETAQSLHEDGEVDSPSSPRTPPEPEQVYLCYVPADID